MPVLWAQFNLREICSWSVGCKEMLVNQIKSAPREILVHIGMVSIYSNTYSIRPNLNGIVLSENFSSNNKCDINSFAAF